MMRLRKSLVECASCACYEKSGLFRQSLRYGLNTIACNSNVITQLRMSSLRNAKKPPLSGGGFSRHMRLLKRPRPRKDVPRRAWRGGAMAAGPGESPPKRHPGKTGTYSQKKKRLLFQHIAREAVMHVPRGRHTRSRNPSGADRAPCRNRSGPRRSCGRPCGASDSPRARSRWLPWRSPRRRR